MARVTKHTFELNMYKDPKTWPKVIKELGLTKKQVEDHFEWGNTVCLEITLDKKLNILSGRLIPKSEW